MMKKSLIVMMISSGLLAGAMGQEAGAKIEGRPVTLDVDEAVPKDLSKLLEEQLIVADGENVKGAKLDKGMEYYLVYHSASW